jgi:GT2 family glycosyltransferase
VNSVNADIVIVNWNSGPLLRECLASIEAFPEGVGQVIVVDNGSTDGSADISALPTRTRIIPMGENVGFAKGCNLGAEHCTAPYILLLNPDARLLANGLPSVLNFMESEQGSAAGIAGIQLVDKFARVQKTCSRSPTLWRYFGQGLGLDRVFPRIFKPHFMLEFDHATTRAVDGVMGAFYLVRSQLYVDLGGMDERFFVYLEEVDFSLRARLAGWSTYHFAGGQAFHLGGGTTDKVKALRLFYSFRSRTLFIFKSRGAAAGVALVLLTLTIEFGARCISARSVKQLGETFRGYRMYLRSLPAVIRTALACSKDDMRELRRLQVLAGSKAPS